MKNNNLRYFSPAELKVIRHEIEAAESKEKLLEALDNLIEEKEKNVPKSLNELYQIDMITTFSLEEQALLQNNKIYSIADLRNCTIESLNGITNYMTSSLKWASEFYNLESTEKKQAAPQKVKTSKQNHNN